MASKKPHVGIALDSGGAMGGAHIGVLEVLAENSIPLDIIVGSSAGAAVGAFFAAGKLQDFRKLITDLSFVHSLSYYVDPVFPTSGLLAGIRAHKFIQSLVGDVLIEDLPITFIAVATDLLTGETVAIDKGPLADAVMASMAIPGIFRPVVHMGRLLADGGVSDPLPLDILMTHCPDISIACNLHPHMPRRFSSSKRRDIIKAEQKASAREEDLASGIIERVTGVISTQAIYESLKPMATSILNKVSVSRSKKVSEIDLAQTMKDHLIASKHKLYEIISRPFLAMGSEQRLNIIEILLSATNIQQYQKNRLMLRYEPPDILIEPDVVDIGAMEFTKGESAIGEGRMKAENAIPELLRMIEEKRRPTSR
jgi:NTE family protein